MTGKVYLNGTILEAEEAKISVYDHGFLYGDGVYETMRSYGGVVFGMADHLGRLERSASLIGLDLPLDPGAIQRAVMDTLAANDLKDAYIRISVSRGPGPIGLDPALCSVPTFVVMVVPHQPLSEDILAAGVSVIVAKTRRNARQALNPMIKSLNFLNNIQAKREAIRAAAFDAVMCSVEGYLAEGTVTNIFFVKKNVLKTPTLDVGLLDGITRRIILRAGNELGIPVEEGRYKPEDLLGADEAFLSNSVIEIVPVTRVDGAPLGDGVVGSVTKKIMAMYRTAVAGAVADAR